MTRVAGKLTMHREGKAFSAGADLNWMRSMAQYSEQENKEDAGALFDMFHSIQVPPYLTHSLTHFPLTHTLSLSNTHTHSLSLSLFP